MNLTIKPWHEWEDWCHGLYGTGTINPEQVKASVALLSDAERFRETALEMISEWPISANHNIYHLWTGKRAWIGQASCCYAHNATGQETREAWGLLTNEIRTAANEIADYVAESFRMGRTNAETLFGH
jgi:hypothetical protein